jgi:hypothetical protein
MKHPARSVRSAIHFAWKTFPLVMIGVIAPLRAVAVGTWSSMSIPPVGSGIAVMLSDGTMMSMDGGGNCVRLTPDLHGSYTNGTWTVLPPMTYGRWDFGVAMLTNANLLVVGGEYGGGIAPGQFWNGQTEIYGLGQTSEQYDSVNNVWTQRNPSLLLGDCPTELLPDGNVLVAPANNSGLCAYYNAVSNNWEYFTIPAAYGGWDECTWVKLPNGCIFGVDDSGQGEHFVPSLKKWIFDGVSPVPGGGGENTVFLLPNGKVLYIGQATNTALYTPGNSPTNAGTWSNGANLPMVNGNQLLPSGEGGGFTLSNGNLLLVLFGNGGAYTYEYNYQSNTFIPAPANPSGGYAVCLPDGTVFVAGGFIYTPSGPQFAAGLPAINSISQNQNGTYHLTGTGLTGFCEGQAAIDDGQAPCNFPLVRLTNNVSGYVYYARTYNWSSGGVQTSNQILTTEFSLPVKLPAGIYSLAAVAVGIPSAPVLFTNLPPATPTGLTGTAGNAQTTLSWNSVLGATAYNVKSLQGGNPPNFGTVATVTGTSCTNLGLVNGQNYYYVVSAVGPQGESANSSPIAWVPLGPPPIPIGLTVTVIPVSFPGAQINLVWSESFGATNYTLKRSTVHNGPYTNLTATSTTSYVDTNLLVGTTYYYVVSATSTSGEGANSAEVSAIVPLAANICLPVRAADVVGSQITFAAAFGGTNFTYQWRKISGGVTNNIAGATTPVLTLSNLQLTDTASYQLQASNSLGVTRSTLSSLTVGSVPTAVNNVITSYAAQTGAGSANVNFVPTWTVASGSLIAGQSPSSAGSGNFTYGTSVLTDGTYGWLTYALSNPTTTQITGGSGAGQSVTYTLGGSVSGYTLTNIVVYGGWCDGGRDQQAYTVYYSTVTTPTNFILLGSANYNPANPGSIQSATRATFVPAGGVLATSVAAVMFDLTTPAGKNGYEGYSEIEIFGSATPTGPIAPYVITNTLPATAADVVGSQVTFTATFGGPAPISYQWRKIKSGVTNNIAEATNTVLTLNNLRVSDAASYQLLASNASGVAVSTPGSLNVNNLPSPVNNVITSMAAQLGIVGTPYFVPTWTVASGSLIAGQLPSSTGGGNFSYDLGLLTDGSYGVLNSQPVVGGASPTEVTCGGSAGQSVAYLLTGSAAGYNLTNITVYGGWGDSGRDQQAYTVYYSKITAPTTFIQLCSVNYNPSNPSSTLSGTRATLTPANGILATNVAAVKFDFTTPPPENGYCGYAEIQMFGVPTFLTAANPTNIVVQVTGNSLTLNWPADHVGWRLQVQTNDVTQGLGMNWVDVAGGTTTNQMTIPIDPANGSVFYRMIYP